MERCGKVWWGKVRQEGHGVVRLGLVWRGRSGEARHDVVRRGEVWPVLNVRYGMAGEVWLGLARYGGVR